LVKPRNRLGRGSAKENRKSAFNAKPVGEYSPLRGHQKNALMRARLGAKTPGAQ
jgi:hypothetical protein